MRNKSTLTFCAFLLACCFTLLTNAQQQNKKKNNNFDLEIVKYSDKTDAEIEHLHLLSLTNNSNKLASYKLSGKPSVKCKMKHKNVVRKRFGDIDPDEVQSKDENAGKKSKPEFSIDIYKEDMSQKIDEISLSPKQSINIYAKITRLSNTGAGHWKCNKVSAKLLGQKKGKQIKKSVKIASFISDPNNKGH